ncbi:MAG: DUF547 domain-containing protein [Bacteroidota bacterium]
MSKLTYILPFLLIGLLSSCGVANISSNSRPVTHELWDSLVQKHVSPQGWVDYEGFLADSLRVNSYLDLLSQNHPNKKNWTEDEQLAYWINAYNAYTVKLVMDHYPVASIKDIKNGIPFVNTVWDIKFIEIEGATYDLNNIEHGIIREQFAEPRIHFAVNCASHSCPKLSNRAFTAKNLDAQLEQAARDFLADTGKNRIRPEEVELSKIFSWYRTDFNKVSDQITEFINPFTDVDVRPDASVEYLDYDWSLNDAKTH